MGSLKRECLNHFIFLSEDQLRRTVTAYVACYNESRPHQGIEGIPQYGPGLPRAPLPRVGKARSSSWLARCLMGFTTIIGSLRNSGCSLVLVASPCGPGRIWSCAQCRILIPTGHNVSPSADA
jgi:integrase-like protein